MCENHDRFGVLKGFRESPINRVSVNKKFDSFRIQKDEAISIALAYKVIV